jgi:hypothetical protein
MQERNGRPFRLFSGGSVTLKSDFLLPQLRGYWKPLGRPVPYEDLHVTTADGMKQVTFLLDFYFQVPGVVETDQASFPASADGTLLLRSGHLTYRVGEDAITIGPGFANHRVVSPPDTETINGRFRVTMTDWTQVDRVVQIRCHRWTEAEGPYSNGGGPVHLEES